MGRQRNFRNKSAVSVGSDEDEDVQLGNPNLKAPASKNDKDKGKVVKPRRQVDVPRKHSMKTPALLSFEEEEEMATTSAAVSGATLNVRPAGARAPQSNAQILAPPPTQRSAPGEYSMERMQQLRQATKQLPGRPAKKSSSSGGGGALKVSGSFKSAITPSDDRFHVAPPTTAVRAPVKQSDDLWLPSPSSRLQPPNAAGGKAKNGTKKLPQQPVQIPQEPHPKGAAIPLLPLPSLPPAANRRSGAEHHNTAPGFSIPNSDAIRRAREKRERLRSAHLAPDYLPLGGAAALTAGQGIASAPLTSLGAQPLVPNTASSTSGDSADEGEAPDSRMLFVGGDPGAVSQQKGRSASRRKPVSGPSCVPHPSAQEEGGSEEEDDEWVQQQLRKAGGGRPYAAPSCTAPPSGTATWGQSSAGAFSHALPSTLRGALHPAITAAAAGGVVVQSLQDGLRRLQEKRVTLEQQQVQAEQKLQEALQCVDRHRATIATASDKYTSVQEMRSYIGDTCDMLQAKAAIVEVLEERLLDASAATLTAAASAAADEDAEQLSVAEAAVAAAVGVLSRGGALPAATAAAERASATAEAALVAALPERLDEFGRDANMEARQAAEARLARRQTGGLPAHQINGSAPSVKVEEGAAESGSAEEARYRRERQHILQAAETVFADASEAFSSIAAVRQRLDSWREEQPAAYRDAYMGMSAPALFAPFVRLQLLSWEPLQDTSNFDTQAWHRDLFDFGGESGSEETDVVPDLVRSLVVPLLKHAALKVWQPASKDSTAALRGAADALLVYCDPSDPPFKDFIAAIAQRLEEEASRIVVPRWAPRALQASPQAATYVDAAFGGALSVLAAAAALEQLLPHNPVTDLAVRQLLLQQVLPHLQAYCTDVDRALFLTEQLMSSMPRSWADGSHPDAAAPLQTFLTDLRSRVIDARRPDPAHVKRMAHISKTLIDK